MRTCAGDARKMCIRDSDNTARAKRFIGNAQIDYKVHGFEALRFNLNLCLDVSSAKTYDGVNPGSFQAYTCLLYTSRCV